MALNLQRMYENVERIVLLNPLVFFIHTQEETFSSDTYYTATKKIPVIS